MEPVLTVNNQSLVRGAAMRLRGIADLISILLRPGSLLFLSDAGGGGSAIVYSTLLLSWVVGYFRIPCRFEAGQKLDVTGIEVFRLIGARRLVVRQELRPLPGQIFSRRFLVIEAFLFRHSRKVCRCSTARPDIKSWDLIRRNEL